MAESIEVRGLDELIARMKAYPGELRKSLALTVTSALTVLWENVPPYPSPPDGSTYDRTGTLGRSLGSGTSGGAAGKPDVFVVKALGSGYEGRFGSNVDYAPYVIGEGTQSKHMGHWWTIKTIAEKSQEKILRLFVTLGEKLASFLDGKA
jgi:hypothetical protein